jgi:hypothetical protein
LYNSPNYLGGQIEKNEIGTACGACREEERCIQGLWGNLREKDHFEGLAIDGRIIL